MAEGNKNKSKYTNLEPNIAAALAYLFTPISGIILFIVEKDDKFVRFHAFQSILAGVAWYFLWTVLRSVLFYSVGFILWRLFSIAGLILLAWLMWKAYNNEKFELPVIGKMAQEQVNK